MKRRSALLLAAAVLSVHLLGCGRQPESLAVAAAPALPAADVSAPANTPIGPLPGEPEGLRPEPVNPFRADPVAMAAGRKLFTAFNCAGCHGDHGGGGMGPSLRDERWIYGGSEAQVASSIASGRAHGMPSWGVKLTTEQMWKLTAYVKSMRTAEEPEPPAGN